MKILLIQPWISYRGAESVSVQEAYHLQKKGVTVSLAALFVDWKRLPQYGNEINYILPHRIISEVLQKNRYLLFIFGPLILFILVFRKRNEFDIFNPHNLPSVWIAAICKRINGKKFIWTAHNVPEKISWKIKKDIFEYIIWLIGASWFDIWAVKQADVIFTVSKPVALKILNKYNKNAKVVYSGINQLKVDLNSLPKEIVQLRNKSKLLILQVAALHSQKRQYESLMALKKIQKKEKTAALIFAGDGPDKEFLVQQVKLHAIRSVYFTGFIPQEAIGAYYYICDIHVLPSIAESFAAAPLEALSLNKLSIVTDKMGVLEALGKYSLRCQPYAESIYKKLDYYLINRKKLDEKAIEGAKYIKKLLSWDKLAESYINTAKILLPKEVSPNVYNEDYYSVHYSREHTALQTERITRLKRSMDLLQIKSGLKILDLGCGIGEFCIQAANLGAEVYGIDYSQEGISIANSRKRNLPSHVRRQLHYKVMDASRLAFPDNYFDRIVCVDVFEHIHMDPLRKVLNEMERIIKPGGIIVIETAPNKFFLAPVAFIAKKLLGWDKFESDEYHINVFDYFRLNNTLKQLSGDKYVTVLNDSHKFFSSRLAGVKKMPAWVKLIARSVDLLLDNPVIEPIILNTPLKIFLAHDLWAVIRVKK